MHGGHSYLLRNPELVVGQQLHPPEELRAPAEARRDLLVVSARCPPAQESPLERTQHVTLKVACAVTGILGEAPHAGDPLRTATKPTSDLVIVDASVDEAENATLDGPKRPVIWHGCLLTVAHTLSPSAP